MMILTVLVLPVSILISELILSETAPVQSFSSEADPLENFINSLISDTSNPRVLALRDEMMKHKEGITDKIISILSDGPDFPKDVHSEVEKKFAAGEWDSAVDSEFGTGTEVALFLKENTANVKQKIFDFLDGKLINGAAE